MMNKTRNILLTLALTASSCLALVATREMGPVYFGIRHNGMGNTSVAIVDDRYSLFNNPAGLDLFKERIEVSLCPLLLHLDNKFADIAAFLINREAQLKDPNLYDREFFDEFSNIDARWAKLGYLPEATIVTRHFGLGAYNVLSTRVAAETGHFIPKLGLAGNEDFVLTAAIANRFAKILSMGFAFKYIYRIVLPDTVFGFSDTYVASQELKSDGALGGDLTAFTNWATLERGIGFDIGSMLHFGATRFGFVMQDMAEYLDGEWKHIRLSVGFSRRILTLMELPFVRDVVFGMDMKDLTGDDSFYNKIHMGAEVDASLVALRVGLSQGYPTFGGALNLSIFHVEYAYLTEEWGYYPGQSPNPAHLFATSLGFKF